MEAASRYSEPGPKPRAPRSAGVISAMSELGIYISCHPFKAWTEFTNYPFDYPQDSYLPVALKRLDWHT